MVVVCINFKQSKEKLSVTFPLKWIFRKNLAGEKYFLVPLNLNKKIKTIALTQI